MTSEKVKFNRIRKRTLNGILKEIPNSGFNENMLIKSSQKLGLEKGEINRIFPEGLEEIKEYFFVSQKILLSIKLFNFRFINFI